MPENQPPESDPFADLYGRLPDPRTGARPSGDAAPGTDTAPPSRRAARAARQTQEGSTAPEPSMDAAPPARYDAARRADSSSASASRPSGAGAQAAPRPTAAPTSSADRRPGAARPAADQRPTGHQRPVSAPQRPAAAPRPAADQRPATDQRPAAAAPGPERARTEAPVREPALVGAGAATASSASSPAASGSLEDLFTGQTTTHVIGETAPRAPRGRRRLGGWIAFAVVVLLFGGIAGGGVALWNTYGDRIQAFLGNGEPLDYEAGLATGEARVTIVSGDTGQSVSPKMFEAGVTKASNSLYKYMVDNAVGFTFQPGVYKLQQQMTSAAVLDALRNPANRLDYSVQLREGLTLKQSLELISEQLSIPRADLDAAVADPSRYGVTASTLEGWIFPATYDFDEGVTATDVISRMVQRTVQSLDSAGVPVEDRERILTIASIIEREARSSEDFYKVSRVIENRLQPDNVETHGLLQMDSTAQYGADELDAGSSSSSENALTSDNPYNTYKYPGLPVGPIANAGDRAIDAAMNPVDGTWYYFTTVNLETGETVFSTTYDDQLKAVEQFRAWCRENPDGGC
ncbi:endolytic transglycosylase MltG [uncultured Microbacterium sp.]|uniref:endolytic transglycosylase MltG n=1 Tax=uncultured Microbacterium sp. TaxID=191216 RepID=UPI0025F51972|nr:endolytic transglycosylase MltG [uncultured Microbacterium sp.]